MNKTIDKKIKEIDKQLKNIKTMAESEGREEEKHDIFIVRKFKDIRSNFQYRSKYKLSLNENIQKDRIIRKLQREVSTLTKKEKETFELKTRLNKIDSFDSKELIKVIKDLTYENQQFKDNDGVINITTKVQELSKPIYIKGRTFKESFENYFIYREELTKYNEEVGKYEESSNFNPIKLKSNGKLPESYTVADRHIKINDKYKRVYYLADIPATDNMPGILYKIMNSEVEMILSMYIKEASTKMMKKNLNDTLTALIAKQSKRVDNHQTPSSEIAFQIEQCQQLIRELVSGEETVYLVSIYFSVEADTLEELIKYHHAIKNAAEEASLRLNVYSYGQEKAFKSILPIVDNSIGKNMLVQKTLLGYLMPLYTKDANDKDGIYIGRSLINSSYTFIDPFKGSNANMLIIAKTGSGKTVEAKTMIMRLWTRGVQNIIIDPEGEYGKMVEELGGLCIKFDSENGLNPFFLISKKKEFVNEHIQTLKQFFKFLIRPEYYDSALLDRILVEIYKENKPNYENIIQKLGKNKTVEDFEVLTKGSLGGVFNSDIQYSFENDLIVFDISALQTAEKKTPAMYLLSSILFELIKKKDRRRQIFIDEAHTLLVNEDTAIFYNNLVKRARKYNAGVTTITQNIEDLLNNERISKDITQSILTNASLAIFMNISTSSGKYIKREFNLIDSEIEYLISAPRGYSLIINGEEHHKVINELLPTEKEIILSTINETKG